MSLQPTSTRFKDPGLRPLFEEKARWQSWLDVEVALAEAQAELGIVPAAAATRIAECARLDLLDDAAIRAGLARTGHPLVPLVWELARVCGEDAGGYVHWGATTQNILETGDNILLRRAHRTILSQIGELLGHLAAIAEKSADMPMAGRTHGQHAVPVTFGYKVAVWIDELLRHVDRLQALEDRVFVAMLGGAAGTYASLGAQGPAVQDGLARILDLKPTPVPSRTHRDREAEYVTALGLVAGTAGKMANEVYTLMKQEFAEASEPVPPGTVGSSTMPQKRNPILCQDVMAGAAQVRALVPLALDAMMTEHEANRMTTVIMRAAIGPACIHIGDCLGRLNAIAAGLELFPERMRANLDLTQGMILSEAIMMELGKALGRQEAHDVIYDAIEEVLAGRLSFTDALARAPKLGAELSPDAIEALMDPARYTGLCADMAREQAVKAREAARSLAHN
ncbi:MAG: adenylosuccinate lyase family protein [Alphaproteobacteria bacterium]|nr:adenylosuccinate lyase family protein [Alphaproteobacteria bacterium]